MISIQFTKGLNLAKGELCANYLECIGVRGETDFTKHFCGSLPVGYSITLNTTGSSLSFRFVTNNNAISMGIKLVFAGIT